MSLRKLTRRFSGKSGDADPLRGVQVELVNPQASYRPGEYVHGIVRYYPSAKQPERTITGIKLWFEGVEYVTSSSSSSPMRVLAEKASYIVRRLHRLTNFTATPVSRSDEEPFAHAFSIQIPGETSAHCKCSPVRSQHTYLPSSMGFYKPGGPIAAGDSTEPGHDAHNAPAAPMTGGKDVVTERLVPDSSYVNIRYHIRVIFEFGEGGSEEARCPIVLRANSIEVDERPVVISKTFRQGLVKAVKLGDLSIELPPVQFDESVPLRSYNIGLTWRPAPFVDYESVTGKAPMPPDLRYISMKLHSRTIFGWHRLEGELTPSVYEESMALQKFAFNPNSSLQWERLSESEMFATMSVPISMRVTQNGIAPAIYRCHIVRRYLLSVSLHFDMGTVRAEVPASVRLHMDELPDYQTSLTHRQPMHDPTVIAFANSGSLPPSTLASPAYSEEAEDPIAAAGGSPPPAFVEVATGPPVPNVAPAATAAAAMP